MGTAPRLRAADCFMAIQGGVLGDVSAAERQKTDVLRLTGGWIESVLFEQNRNKGLERPERGLKRNPGGEGPGIG